MGHKLGRNGVQEDLYKRSIFSFIWWNKMATRVNLSFWLANFQNLTYLKLGSNALKLYRIVNNNGLSKLSTFRAAQKAPVADVVIQRCHWNHVGKLLFHKISTILFVAVPLIFIYMYIQVSDSGSHLSYYDLQPWASHPFLYHMHTTMIWPFSYNATYGSMLVP
jgi:hypothetical protein